MLIRVNINHFSKYFRSLCAVHRRLHESHARNFMYFHQSSEIIIFVTAIRNISHFFIIVKFHFVQIKKKRVEAFHECNFMHFIA